MSQHQPPSTWGQQYPQSRQAPPQQMYSEQPAPHQPMYNQPPPQQMNNRPPPQQMPNQAPLQQQMNNAPPPMRANLPPQGQMQQPPPHQFSQNRVAQQQQPPLPSGPQSGFPNNAAPTMHPSGVNNPALHPQQVSGGPAAPPLTDIAGGDFSTFDTQHTDVIHDTQFDYYGHFLATASSDRTVKVFYAGVPGFPNRTPPKLVATLAGHEGPVWMVSWGHPRFGNVLASASFDHRCIVWKETSPQTHQWTPVHVIDVHEGSVNAVEWAPEQFGPILATASSDGSVAVTGCTDKNWGESVRLGNNKVAHALGAASVSFAPFNEDIHGIVLASGGCDCAVRLWYSGRDDPMGQLRFSQLTVLGNAHSEWIRDVAFSPSCASTPYVVLASGGQDNTVFIYRTRWSALLAEESRGEDWERTSISFDEAVWRLSWSSTGEMLLVTTGDSQVFVLTMGEEFTDAWLKVPLSEYQDTL